MKILHLPSLLVSFFILIPIVCIAQQNQHAILAKPLNNQILFVQNIGQVQDESGAIRPDILFTAPGNGVRLYFTKQGVSHVFLRTDSTILNPFSMNGSKNNSIQPSTTSSAAGYRLDLQFIGSNPNATITSDKPTDSYMNFYQGNQTRYLNQTQWQQITYHDIYPFIDLVYLSSGNQLKYEFHVRPGGNPNDIRMKYVGANSILIDSIGGLSVRTPFGIVTETAPYTYQNKNRVDSRFNLNADTVLFSVDAFDSSKTLVIDPGINWATYYGGSNNLDIANSVTVGANNDVLVTGYTMSTDFPISPGTYTPKGNLDAVVIRLDSLGNRKWATYVGGNDIDAAYSIATDVNDNIWVSGDTKSPNLPTTATAYQKLYGSGSYDAFFMQLNSSGTLLYLSFLGGSDYDGSTGIVVDKLNYVWIVGSTGSSNFPVTANAYQRRNNGIWDAFIVRLDLSANVLWATYFGGPGSDHGKAIAANSGSNTFIVGTTLGTTLPLSSKGMKQVSSGGYEGFGALIDSAGQLQWSTLFGGTNNDWGKGAAMDNQGNAIALGWTISNNVNMAPNAIQPANAGAADIILYKLAPSGTLLWSTYYGGTSNDYARDIETDRMDNIALVGSTESSNFPVTSDAYQSVNNGSSDAVVVKLSPSGQVIWSTYYGGSNAEYARLDGTVPGEHGYGGITVDASGHIIIVGDTQSGNLPETSKGFQKNYAGFTDMFVVKFDGCSQLKPSITSSTGSFVACGGDSIILRAPPGYASYRWSNNSTGQSIAVSTSGRYVVQVYDIFGCTGLDSVDVLVFPKPKVIAGPDTSICSSQSTPLFASNGFRYKWSPASSLNCDTCQNPIARPNTTTTYVVTVTDANGCTADDSVTVTIRPFAMFASLDTTIKCTDSARLISSGGTNYRWSPAGSLSCDTCPNPIARPKTTTTYVVTVTDTATGCMGKDSVTVFIFPFGRVMSPDTVIRCGDSARLAVSGGSSYLWSPAGSLSCDTCPNPVARPNTLTRYKVIISNPLGCWITDSVSVGVLPFITSVSPDTVVRCGDSVRLSANGGTRYRWLPSSGLSCDTCPNPVARPGTSTTYAVQITNAIGCVVIDSVNVNVLPFIASAKPDTTIQCGDTVRFSAASGFRYRWLPSTGLDCDTCANPFAAPKSTISYIVTMTNQLGCSVDDTVTVQVNPFTLSLSADTTIRCGDSIRLQASGAASYRWSPSNGLSCDTCQNPMAMPIGTTTYNVMATNRGGCTALSSVTVNVIPFITSVSPDSSVPCGNAATLSATGGVRYQWSPPDGLSCDTCSTTTAAPNKPTTYTVTITNAAGCTETRQVRVNITPTAFVLDNTSFKIDSTSIFDSRCKGYIIRNTGTAPMRITSCRLLHNTEFSVPPSQLPLVIPPGASGTLTVCYKPSSAITEQDTLILLNDCSDAQLAIASQGYIPTLTGDVCTIRLQLRSVGATSLAMVSKPEPNPAREKMVIPIAVQSPDKTLPEGECRLFDLLGRPVASGFYEQLSTIGTSIYGRFSINTSSLPSGFYYVAVTIAGQTAAFPVGVSR